MKPNHTHFANRIIDAISGRGWVTVVELRRILKWGDDNANQVPSINTIVHAMKAEGLIETRNAWPSQGDVGKGYAVKIKGEDE